MNQVTTGTHGCCQQPKCRFPREMRGAVLDLISEGMAGEEGETFQTEGSTRTRSEATIKQSQRAKSWVKTTPDAHSVEKANSVGVPMR